MCTVGECMNADTIEQQDAKDSSIYHQGWASSERIHIDRRQVLRESAIGMLESAKYKSLPFFFFYYEWLFGLCFQAPGAFFFLCN